MQRYEICLMHVREFLSSQYNLSDLPVSKISFKFLKDFEYYLLSIRKCANNSAIKYVKNLGKIVRICLGNGWLTIDPYTNYKPKTKKTQRTVLTKEELIYLAEKQFSIERQNQVRDIFIFSCYTGLAYVDARKLNARKSSMALTAAFEFIPIGRKRIRYPAYPYFWHNLFP